MRSTPFVVVVLAGLVSVGRAEPDDPKLLLATGLAHERAGEWIAARHDYEKLALAKGFADQARYLQAWTALQAGDDDAALKLAAEAVKTPGAFQHQARFVYGDALYHRGDFKRAKDFFIGLRDHETGEAKIIASNKLAACEHMLDPTAAPVAAPAPQPAVADTPKALLEAAATLEQADKWTEARALYVRLEKHKGYEGHALYRQAWAAFQSNDNSDAQSLAERAAKVTGPHQLDAKMLYGDAIFRSGDFTRAKQIYLGVLASVPADHRVMLAKKVVLCNKQLQLPERDGLPSP
jgi:TolA-binding protein